jgi:hypothetical protein
LSQSSTCYSFLVRHCSLLLQQRACLLSQDNALFAACIRNLTLCSCGVGRTRHQDQAQSFLWATHYYSSMTGAALQHQQLQATDSSPVKKPEKKKGNKSKIRIVKELAGDQSAPAPRHVSHSRHGPWLARRQGDMWNRPAIKMKSDAQLRAPSSIESPSAIDVERTLYC